MAALRALDKYVYANYVQEVLTYIENPDSDPKLKGEIESLVNLELESSSSSSVRRSSSSSSDAAFLAGVAGAEIMHQAEKQREKERKEWEEWRWK